MLHDFMLGTVNHLIRDIANVVYEGDEYVSERGTLSIFTQIAEQDLISVKHVKDAAIELTPVEKFNRGIQSLMSYNQDERNEGIGYVLESLKGSIFKNNFLPTVEDIVTKTNRAVEERDRVLTEGVMLLSDLMNTDEARSIYNSKYIKGRDSLSNEQKIEALKQGMGNVSSPLLEERRQTLNEGIGIFTDESGKHIAVTVQRALWNCESCGRRIIPVAELFSYRLAVCNLYCRCDSAFALLYHSLYIASYPHWTRASGR
mgnify:CR=1 FL=1